MWCLRTLEEVKSKSLSLTKQGCGILLYTLIHKFTICLIVIGRSITSSSKHLRVKKRSILRKALNCIHKSLSSCQRYNKDLFRSRGASL